MQIPSKKSFFLFFFPSTTNLEHQRSRAEYSNLSGNAFLDKRKKNINIDPSLSFVSDEHREINNTAF